MKTLLKIFVVVITAAVVYLIYVLSGKGIKYAIEWSVNTFDKIDNKYAEPQPAREPDEFD